MQNTSVAVFLAAIFAAAPIHAQPPGARLLGLPPLPVPRIASPITVDGRVDEPAWQQVEALDGLVHVPNFGAEPSERTEFRVAHDGEHLYFSCSAFTTDPANIQGLSLERDEVGFGSDTCAIYIDSLNDGENALGFRTTPTGNRTDFHFTGNGAASSTNWNTFWDVAVSQDRRGWYAEFRIPFSSLLLQADNGRVEMGFTALRGLARISQRVTHPAVSPEWGNFSFARPSVMRRMVLEGVRQVTPLYVTPYALLGGGYAHALNAQRTAYDRSTDRVREAGLDARYGLTSNLTMDVTVNTDFAQVEADDQQINLTRFSLFFPEKRRFFQERSVNFDFGLGGNERLFHSRQIGLVGGEPVTIYGGARLVGRVGEWDVGLLDMQTAASRTLPSENLGVLRLRRRILNENSYVGGILTSRLGRHGQYNQVYGTDAIVRLAGDDYLTLNWAQSFDDDEVDDDPRSPLERALYRVNLERRREDGLAYTVDFLRSGAVFEPKMGFLRRRDYTQAANAVSYGWRHGADSPWLSHKVGVDSTAFRRNGDGIWESAEVTPTVTVESKAGNTVTVTMPAHYEDLAQGFSLPGGNRVPVGTYRFVGGMFRYSASQRNHFRPSFSFEGGQFYDGRQVSFGFTPVWSPSRHFRADVTYRMDHVTFPARGGGFTAHIARARTEVMLSTRWSATTFVQYSSSDNAVVGNFRFRYNPREGTDLYVVWNEGLVTDRFDFTPSPPFAKERTILVKYSHTFAIGL